LAGLAGYAYFGDMSSDPQEMRMPVELDLGAAPATPAPTDPAPADPAAPTGTPATAASPAPAATPAEGTTTENDDLD
nr:hypothetical protein [Paracoccus sp. (in: a-proteobacteria)]